ncbi:hypothetical protein U9M48_018873 [Paspalum notatum var. saurae]|uniref:Reverse transcriptase Ty1/copia-type domain-containing protein n=1 Tax=Paspalum notatum var. saurae TaxID=547442 RepID=A0AAQ3TEF9_PASNO
MTDEYRALIDNETWRLVPRPQGANVVTGKWVFKHKFHSDGTLAHHKARWVVRGFSQQPSVDYDETFSPVDKPATIRVVLSIAASGACPIHQLDVKNAFLHRYLEETVYCQQPSGFVNYKHLGRGTSVSRYLCLLGFVASASDTSLFVYKDRDSAAYLLLYVDDIILTASSLALLQHTAAVYRGFHSKLITECLHAEFAMMDLGALHHFLGISITRSSDGLFLSQR